MRKLILSGVALLAAFVFSGGSWAATVSVPGGYATIQGAVDHAQPGDTVMVGPGVYVENVVINRPLKVVSVKGPAETIVRAASAEAPAIKIADVEGASLIGFTATGSNIAGIFLTNVRKSVLSNNLTVENNYGIELMRSSGNTISGNTANHNVIYGIYLEKSTENNVTENSANSNDDKGFFISYSDNNKIIKNIANLNTWNGILVWSSHNNVIQDNITLRNPFGLVMSESGENASGQNTTLPNLVLILPIFLVYMGIITYMVQKLILRIIYRS